MKMGLRLCRDLWNGDHGRMAVSCGDKAESYCIKRIEQSIKATETSVFKTHNISLAIERLNHIMIAPGQLFSFWRLVKEPSHTKGYKKSRTIIGNLLQEEVGGGLCQLSGLIYFLAIHAGMKITERHSHSRDIYRDEERFTALGSDATIVYGYKDLRFMNPYPFPVCMSFSLTAQTLSGMFTASEKIEAGTISFEYNSDQTHVHVTTLCKTSGSMMVLDKRAYLLYTA
jgi:vancomycin resistance protein VanW